MYAPESRHDFLAIFSPRTTLGVIRSSRIKKARAEGKPSISYNRISFAKTSLNRWLLFCTPNNILVCSLIRCSSHLSTYLRKKPVCGYKSTPPDYTNLRSMLYFKSPLSSNVTWSDIFSFISHVVILISWKNDRHNMMNIITTLP